MRESANRFGAFTPQEHALGRTRPVALIAMLAAAQPWLAQAPLGRGDDQRHRGFLTHLHNVHC
jgi:hypothetical protein